MISIDAAMGARTVHAEHVFNDTVASEFPYHGLHYLAHVGDESEVWYLPAALASAR